MKKLILSLFLLISATSIAQDADFNMQKYWYLRWRLKNYFMVVGPNYGEGYPAGIRNKLDNVLNTGDAANYLGTYLGVLATEIKLLKSKDLDYSETKRELYYALYAINRWDDCEDHYPWGGFDDVAYQNEPFPSNLIGNYVPSDFNSGKYNGACLRQDTPNDFVVKNYDVLNKDLDLNFTNNNEGNPRLIGTMYNEGLNPQFDTETTFCELCGYESLFNYLRSEDANVECSEDDSKDYCNAIDRVRAAAMLSQDHISSLLMGLALVVKSLDEAESYNGIAFQDGSSSFVLEAKKITGRLITYLEENEYDLKDPDLTEIEDRWGGNAIPYSYGFASAALKITGLQGPIGVAGLDNSGAWWLVGEGALIASETHTSIWIYLKLLCVGDANGGPFSFNSYRNQDKIYNISAAHEWRTFYPLIHSYLNDVACLTSDLEIEQLLNAMPCGGNWSNSSSNSAPWATPIRFHASIIENYRIPANWDNNGVFTGLEYMLMFNLYTLKNTSYPVNYASAKVHDFYPYTSGIINHTTHGANDIPTIDARINPSFVYSNEPLVLNTNIFNGPHTVYIRTSGFFYDEPLEVDLQANVSFRSAKSIDPGVNFYMDPGVAYFELKNDPYECNESATGYEFRPRENVYQENNGSTINEDKIKDTLRIQTELIQTLDSLNKASLEAIKIRPNPSKGVFYVSKKQNKISKIIVFNLLGEKIYETNTIYDETKIDLTEHGNGMYIVECFDGQKSLRFKVFKD